LRAAEEDREMITCEQVRPAQKLLGWSQMALALEAGLNQATVAKFESAEGRSSVLSASTVRRTLEGAGVGRRAWSQAEEEKSVSITPEQLIEARKLLRLSLSDLASRVGATARIVGDFERGYRLRPELNLARLRAALEAAGVEFTNGAKPGVKSQRRARSR
jgi:transcriptional regulator with XRE-family HTH domain